MRRTKTSRQQIQALLKTKGIASVNEISELLHFTRANTRNHLANLVREGLVFVAGYRNPPNRGRRMKLYRLVAEANAHNFNLLSKILLNKLLDSSDKTQQDSIIKELAQSMGKTLTQEFKETTPVHEGNFSQRLSNAVLLLNQLHYRARWEAHTSGPRIVFNHCPYHTIIDQHPELCLLDKSLLNFLLRLEIRQNEKLELDFSGLPYCSFIVNVER